jgi:hypothetical protein
MSRQIKPAEDAMLLWVDDEASLIAQALRRTQQGCRDQLCEVPGNLPRDLQMRQLPTGSVES